MALSLPAIPNLDELKAELTKCLSDLQSRIDKDAILDIWHKWKSVIGITCGTLLISMIFVSTCRKISRSLTKRRLRLLIEERQRQREANLDQLHKRLAMSASPDVVAKRREIVSLTFEDLHRHLQKGNLTASEVLEAYQWRALEAHMQTNCICEFLLEASAWTTALDARYGKNSTDVKPPLFGIPISVSEAHELSGHDSTIGLISFMDQPCNEDSILIKTIKQLGAVPFIITNISQGLLSVGCSNPIFGTTMNPHDPARSAGGSSGGEAALIAMRGSPLGIGVDIPGGGLRIPAHWCGVCSLKPTSNRLSNFGIRHITQSRIKEVAVAGPIGPNVDSIVRFMRSVSFAGSPMYDLDPYTAPVPFDEQSYADTQPLTIGYYPNDGMLSPVPACTRAVDVAKRILESKGHRVIAINLPFDPDEMRDLLGYYAAILFPDGGDSVAKILENEAIDKSDEPFYKFLAMPILAKRLLSKKAKSKRIAAIYGAFSSTISHQEAIWTKIYQYRLKFIRFCSERNLDGILCPALATTPLPIGVPEKMFLVLWWYTAIWTLLDCPAGVVRCTNVTSSDERTTAVQSDEMENDSISVDLRKNVEGTIGLPVGVQCVALPFREEVCLRMMKDVEGGVRI